MPTFRFRDIAVASSPAALICALVATAGAHPRIDSFEYRPFVLTAALPAVSQNIDQPGHMLGKNRYARIGSTSGAPISATLAVSHVSDDGPRIDHEAGTYFNTSYEFNADPVDLTEGGTYVAISITVEVEGETTPGDPFLHIQIRDTDGRTETVTEPIPTSGTYRVYFSEFTSAAVDRVEDLLIRSRTNSHTVDVQILDITRSRLFAIDLGYRIQDSHPHWIDWLGLGFFQRGAAESHGVRIELAESTESEITLVSAGAGGARQAAGEERPADGIQIRGTDDRL